MIKCPAENSSAERRHQETAEQGRAENAATDSEFCRHGLEEDAECEGVDRSQSDEQAANTGGNDPPSIAEKLAHRSPYEEAAKTGAERMPRRYFGSVKTASPVALPTRRSLGNHRAFILISINPRKVAERSSRYQKSGLEFCGFIPSHLLPENDRARRIGVMSEPLLEVTSLSKSFGGIVASDRLSLKVDEGELHALIGPNGAGKTTLVNQLAGETRPDSGSIRFAGRDITRLSTNRRVMLGLARSFQITTLFLDFKTIDNVALAIQARAGHSFRFWRNARAQSELRQPALTALQRVGLAHRADTLASQLSHGEHRQLEIAIALASRPRMLLLDEPMAGLGPEEATRMVELLRELKREFTILLIEHDMDAVFALADRITVLVDGHVLASDVPARIRANPEVQQAYIGTQEVAADS